MSKKKKSDKIGHTLEVTRKPIEILGRFDVVEMDDVSDYEVKIDGKVCTPKLAKLILRATGVIP